MSTVTTPSAEQPPEAVELLGEFVRWSDQNHASAMAARIV